MFECFESVYLSEHEALPPRTGRSDSVPTGLFFPKFLESIFKAEDLFP